MSPVQARSFVGRTSELWELHGKLTANQIGIITGVYGQATAQVRGLGGNGNRCSPANTASASALLTQAASSG